MHKGHELKPQMPDFATQTKRSLRPFRRKAIHVKEATERDKTLRMANPEETEAEFAHRIILESDSRRYTPKSEVVEHFFYTKNNISPQKKEVMDRSVDTYYRKLKASRSKSMKQIVPRELKTNEIPQVLYDPWVGHNAPRVSRKITREFDKSDYYQNEIKPLSPVRSDVFAFRAFREFIEKNNERLPSMMQDQDFELKLEMLRKPKATKSPRKFC